MQYRNHPIQIHNIIPRELHFVLKNPGKIIDKNNPKDLEDFAFEIRTGSSKYNSETKRIEVGIRANCGNSDTARFSMVVELVGIFSVDEKNFNESDLEHWTKYNAPFILHPYLREHVFSLSIRAGIEPLLLPLIAIPTPEIMPTQN